MKALFAVAALPLLVVGCKSDNKERTSLELAKLKAMSVSSHQTLPFWNAQRTLAEKHGVPQEGIDELGRAYDKVIRKYSGIGERIPDIAAVYDRMYTKKEITALVNFFETSEGESVMRKEALVFQEIMVIAKEELSKINSEKMLEEIRTEGEAVMEKYVPKPEK